MKLYLDDWRRPPDGADFVSADNYADFLALVDKYRGCLELVDLDFDLGWDSRYSGLDALKYMKRHGIVPDHINVHSTHVSGRDMMLRFAAVNFPDSEVTGWEICF